MNKSELSLLGGSPVRSTSFRSLPAVDEREISAVSEALRAGLLSRFVGSDLPGTRELLKKDSRSLREIDGTHSFLGGPNVRKFEADWADFHEVPYAISMNSATSAATAVLMALDVGPGAEVITTPFSFTATATSIVLAQAVPVFADIDPDTMCLDPHSVEKAISQRTKCIMPVHWCGSPGDFQAILEIGKKYKIPVVEDAAQAPGTKFGDRFLGAYGAAGTFSFSEPKNVTTGEGGMVITHDPQIAEKCRLIRNHGEVVPSANDPIDYLANSLGYNFRMTEITAALGWVQTAKLRELNRIRHDNYAYLTKKLLPILGDICTPQKITNLDTFAGYTAAFRWRSDLTGVPRDIAALALRKEGIPVATGVGRLMSAHPMFTKRIAFGKDGWPFTAPGLGAQPSYEPEAMRTASRLHDQEYLAFFLMGQPNGPSDMDDIVAAFKKIVNNLDMLRIYAENNGSKPIPYDRGRG